MTRNRFIAQACAGLIVSALALPVSVLAQDTPQQTLGLTTGITFNDNRGLDDPSQGDTTELFTRLDFGRVFATPLQSLSLNGSVTLRGINGAEEGSIEDGLSDPNLRLSYNRAVREAQLTVTAFARQAETSTLIQELDGVDLVDVTDNATRLTYGFDTSLELRRTAPFGVTFSTGYTGLRYSDTNSTSLVDQDRFRLGANFRFNINPVVQANLRTQYSTFESDDTALRETYRLNGSLDRDLSAGRIGVTAGITSVEEGERYSLGLTRSIEGPLWDISGSLGIEQGVAGDNFANGSLDIAHELQNGTMALSFDHGLRSGLEDNEQEFTRIQFNYARQLSALGSVNVNLSYRETNPTGTGGTTSLGTIGVSYGHTLAPGWQMNMGVNRRISTDSSGTTAHDNRLSLSVRRELSALR